MKELEAATNEKAAEKKDDSTTLIVNARPRDWSEKHIKFREVVELAFGQFEDNANIEYTVTYSNGPHPNPQGTMVDGDRVKIQDRMNFNVARTDKS
jgi:hypothetical protein